MGAPGASTCTHSWLPSPRTLLTCAHALSQRQATDHNPQRGCQQLRADLRVAVRYDGMEGGLQAFQGDQVALEKPLWVRAVSD